MKKIINERFDDELCGPCLKTLTLYRIINKEKIFEILVDSEHNKIIFYKNQNGHSNNYCMANKTIKSKLLPKGKIKLNEKGEYIWSGGEWKIIKNFIKLYNFFN